MSVYKTDEGKAEILALYDEQLSRLGREFRDIYVGTSFGVAHVVETGNFDGIPLLLLHGGNSTAAFTLLTCGFLMRDFHIYAADITGRPGKSDEVSLSARTLDYGTWAGDIITALGFVSMACFAGSFGAGVLAKAMCVCPEKIKCAVLYVPAGISNAPAVKSASMMYSLMRYKATRDGEWLKKVFALLSAGKCEVSEDMLRTAGLSILHTKVKAAMPSNVPEKLMKNCKAPTLVMAAELDCLFPGRAVIVRARKMLPFCRTYLLEDRGHLNELTDKEKRIIIGFLLKYSGQEDPEPDEG